MKTIEKQKNNLGGIAKIWLIPSARISSALFDSLTEPEDLPVGWDTNTWQMDPVFQSASFQEESKVSAAGRYYENTVAFKIAYLGGGTIHFLKVAADDTHSILIKDQNGAYFLVGNADFPMRLASSAKTGADLSDLNHVLLTFAGMNTQPSIWVADPFV